ncbi:hypothetical protein, partial [Klebsiella pneumoniae]|uniref:hypothetical protein n=1 Tax=Klebsiella pneumoniae TaxID=573 RepID=UPI001C60BFEF
PQSTHTAHNVKKRFAKNEISYTLFFFTSRKKIAKIKKGNDTSSPEILPRPKGINVIMTMAK